MLIISSPENRGNITPGSHDAIQFEVVSHYIPSNWEIIPGTLTLFQIGPKAWKTQDFWERCYDGDLEALEIYKREARIIINEENNVASQKSILF